MQKNKGDPILFLANVPQCDYITWSLFFGDPDPPDFTKTRPVFL